MWLGLIGIFYGPIDDFCEGPSYLTLRIIRVGSLNAGVFCDPGFRVAGGRRGAIRLEVIFTR